MAFKEIEKSILKSKFDIYRKSVTKDSIGGILETWTKIYSNVVGILSSDTNVYRLDETGGKVYRTHSVRFPAKHLGLDIILHENDKVYAVNSSYTYKAIGVERVLNSAGRIHHRLVSLVAYREIPTEPEKKSVSAKAYIE